MEKENSATIDALVYRRVRVFWLYFGCAFSMIFIISPGCWQRTVDLLDFYLIACVIFVIVVFLLMRKADIQSRYSFTIGWLHACIFLYISLCIMFLSSCIFAFGTIESQNTEHIKACLAIPKTFNAIARGFALYFFSTLGLYIACKDRKAIPLPPIEFQVLLFLFLYLTERLFYDYH